MALDLSTIGYETRPHALAFDFRTLATYALGVGAKRDELDYLYEGRGPKVFATFAVVPTAPAVFECLNATGADFEMVVHGAQSVTIHRDPSPSATLSTRATVKAVHDLKRLAQIAIVTETHEEGVLVAETEWSIIVRNGGGFGGSPPKKRDEPKVPQDRPADFVITEATSPEQALLYRLSGDKNPLHADPELAARVGFAAGPLLHGLCTYGFALRAFQRACPGRRVRRIDAKFQKPVWPGETLATSGFELDDGRTVFTTKVVERAETVMTGWLDAPREG